MINQRIFIRRLLLLSGALIVFGLSGSLFAQAIGASGELKWLRINELHSYFSEQGSEGETGGTEGTNVTFSWPGQYGIKQSTMRARGMWLGCRDYYDSKIDRTFSHLVTNVGMKPNEYSTRPIFDAYEFKLVGKFEHPIVAVDGELASANDLYDVLDDVDESIPADRMLVIKTHTSIGVTVIKRVYAFTQQNHDNYFITDFILKNTGIIDNEGTVNPQTIKDFRFARLGRYALSGESINQDDADAINWGVGDAQWGRNAVNDVVGTDPSAPEFNDPSSMLYQLRGNMAWYGPHSGRQVPLEDDWGCPNQLDDGVMAAAKYVGHATLYADKSVTEKVDDLSQPVTTLFIDSDSNPAQRAASQYDEPLMQARYEHMSIGHGEKTHAQEIEDTGLPANEWGGAPNGVAYFQGWGPYTLEPGDSVHIVVVGGVSGLKREKNREVGGKWLQYYNGTGSPELVMPDGSTTTDHTAYKKAWVLTCRDSLLQTFQNAIANFQSGFDIPQPPPPPSSFTVTSGGDRIRLSWDDNAMDHPYFDGYAIYRSEGNVGNPKTVYKKLFECNAGSVVHTYDDTSAVRGFDYYYYIQSKDDGSQNLVEPGKPLRSGMFWTLTTKWARLRREAGMALEEVRVVPNPYDIRSRAFQFGEEFQYDRLAFYGLPPFCSVKVFTERGDLIWEKEHTDGSGDEVWDSLTSSRQIIVSGIYILYVQVTEDTYDQETGDLKFAKGEHVTRKFVVIR